ncbi:hypothetical protein JL720_17022 [Aureococcus anophagefferens]|nr:hypothetical protein JL720_17022 [Aureococcus anophagefferens]
MASRARSILRAKCHFEVLDLPQKQATCEAVKQAYRAAAQEVHPDHLDHADAAKAFARLRTSYEALQTNGGRTRHLMLLRRNPPARPSVLLKVLDEAGSTKGLAAAAAVFIAAELLRLAIADDEPAPAAPVRTFTPERRATATPRAPAFASNAGELYGGATSAEVQSSVASALEKRRDKRRDDAAAPLRARPPFLSPFDRTVLRIALCFVVSVRSHCRRIALCFRGL